MLSSMYKNFDLGFVGTGNWAMNWTMYAYCLALSGLGSRVSGRWIAKGRFCS